MKRTFYKIMICSFVMAVLIGLTMVMSSHATEVQVNTYTTNDQQYPSVAMDASGNFVIAWHSDGQDGDGLGVYAQRYDSAGNPVGAEFQVNTYTTNDQGSPSVAMDASGNFVIAWHSGGQDGDGLGVYAQRYDSAGNPVGAEFRVNTYTTNDQYYPSVAMNASGNFVIAWQFNPWLYVNDYDIHAQRYDSAGNPVGSEFRVNTYMTDWQRMASVAMNADGNFVIAWQSFGQSGSGDGIYAQRYDSAGNPVGAEFRVNTYTTSQSHLPSVAMDADGNFVIAWHSDGQDGDGLGVYAQRYDSAGNPVGAEFRVNTYTTSAQGSPSVAMNADGNFVIAWESWQDGSGYGIFMKRYASPDILVSPTSYNFGNVQVGSSSAPQTFTISNTGTADLHISGMALSDTANYSLNVNGGSSPCASTTPTINSDSSCTVTITFSPSSTGKKDANLTVTSDDPDTPTINIQLTGVGVLPPITLLAPNSSLIIPSGSIYTIQWTAPQEVVKFDLLYSLNNGTAWNPIVSNITASSYDWQVPTPSNNKKGCLVKVTGYDSSDIQIAEDISDNKFTIEVLKVTSPNGKEVLKSGRTWTITWRTNGTIRPVSKTKLFYTTNGGSTWTLIKAFKTNPGRYTWSVPSASSSNCKIKVVLKDSAGIIIGSDVSDKVFTIQP